MSVIHGHGAFNVSWQTTEASPNMSERDAGPVKEVSCYYTYFSYHVTLRWPRKILGETLRHPDQLGRILHQLTLQVAILLRWHRYLKTCEEHKISVVFIGIPRFENYLLIIKQ